MRTTRPVTVRMAPELIQDLSGNPYIREATPEEAREFDAAHPSVTGMDGCGRPYFHMVVDVCHAECPPDLTRKALTCYMMRWL